MPNDALVTKADLVRRLHCAEGHPSAPLRAGLHGVRLMVEKEAECDSALRQLLAVRAARLTDG